MSDAGQLVGGGEAAPTELTEAQFAEGLEGLLDDTPKRRERQPQRASDAPRREAPAEQEHPDLQHDPMPGPEDPAPSEEEEDDAREPDDVVEGDDLGPQSEPPNGWSSDEKELFRSLPPEAQAVIARREIDRERAFVQKTQEVAEHRKALESTFSVVENERQAYANNLQQLLLVAAPEAEKFANLDWQRLASEQPAEYVRLTAERDALRGRIGGIQQELQRVAAMSQQAQAHQFAQIRQAEQQRLVEALPDFGDPQRAPRKIAEMRGWLNQHGFSDQEIGQVVDHRIILVVEEAMQASRAREARKQAETKRSNGASRVQPPASRQRSDSQAEQRRNQKMAALKQSGSEKDAIGYLLEIL